VPHIATNEDKVWQQMRFREKPDERLKPLLINYHGCRWSSATGRPSVPAKTKTYFMP